MLIIKAWNFYQGEKLKQINLDGIAIAKQSALMHSVLESFGKSSAKETDLSQFLPFQDMLQDKVITQETADCFWEATKLIPANIVTVFFQTKLKDQLSNLKES